jgi:hypothetical protein
LRLAAIRRAASCRKALVIMFFSCTAAVVAIAQDIARAPRELTVSSSLERVVAPAADAIAAPVRISVEAATAEAEQLIVSVRFTNVSDHVVDSIRVTSAVPTDARYVPHSASGPGSEVLFSADDGKSFGRPDELTFTAADGSVRKADPAEYTHVRWVLRAPLDAGAAGVARFRAVPR